MMCYWITQPNIHIPCPTETTVGTEIDKLVERLGILPALDLTRLRLVVYEMVLHRQWISPNIRLFAGGTWAPWAGVGSWGYPNFCIRMDGAGSRVRWFESPTFQ